jgi:hypothetical protein
MIAGFGAQLQISTHTSMHMANFKVLAIGLCFAMPERKKRGGAAKVSNNLTGTT